jgi:hypothetical protein
VNDEIGIGVVGVSGSPVHWGGRSIGMVEEDRDGILPSAVAVVHARRGRGGRQRSR